MITYPEALVAIAAEQPFALTTEMPLSAALGRWLAEPIRLAGDQPAFDRATMDGYALRLVDGQSTYRVVGTVLAGAAFAGELAPGDAVRIMTGAPAPTGTSVVPHELTDRGETQVTITDAKGLAPRRNIAWRGEDGRAHAIVVPAHQPLSPTTLAVAAMAGAQRVRTWQAPRLAVVTTGDEIGGAGAAAIADSNGPLLTSLLQALHLGSVQCHARDEAEALRTTIASAAASADLVITTGGVSAGARDLVPDIAAQLGFTTIFHHVAIQPGKPVFLARRPGPRGAAGYLIGLPGNPVSVLATAHLFLLPLLGRFFGGWQPRWLTLPLAAAWDNLGQRHLFLPARLTDGGVAPIRWNGSGDLIAAGAGDGLVELPVGFTGCAGTPVRFQPYVGATHPGVIPPR